MFASHSSDVRDKQEYIKVTSRRSVKLKNQTLAPGISFDDENIGIAAGTAEHPRSLSFSTCAAGNTEVSQRSDVASVTSGSEESMNMIS